MRHDQILLTVSIVLIHLLNLMRCKTTVDPEVDYGYELKRTPEQIKTELEKHKIIPDLLDKAPNETIHIEWMDRDGKWDRNGLCAKLGNEITRVHELECRPLWVNYRTFLKEVHTLMMIGLDEPSSQNRSSSLFLYWLVSDIPAHSYENEQLPALDYVRGETIFDYREPRPLLGTGLHRYVFLVYAHGNRTINCTMKKLNQSDVTGRPHFNLKDFVRQYDLGEPYAVNFFVAQWQKPLYTTTTSDPNEPTTLVVEHLSERWGGAIRMRSKKVKEKDS
nr:PREDICTED: OV-16 antigen-like [Bemisia tabaci]